MEVKTGAEDGFVREWAPCTHMLNLIPPKVQSGLFSSELNLTCIDAVDEFIALGTNVGLIYWYSRRKGDLQRLRCENNSSCISYVKIVNTVDYMVAAGNHAGQVSVFQIPKEHPDSVPDSLKPKVEPKVERYTIGDLHKSKITAIEWSKNGMKLFSGDKNGIIIMTEIDFYMHLCKSSEVVNEGYEITQMSYHRDALLVSSSYRSVVCSRQDARWQITQLGKKERKSLCLVGGVFQWSWGAGGGAAAVYCARPGLRLWRASIAGDVHNTLIFKEAISNPLIVAELLNPSPRKHNALDPEYNFGPLHVFREQFLVTHNEHILYVLDPRTATAIAVVDDLRRILSVSVNKDEIFVLEGPRSVVRLGVAPETNALRTEEKGYSLSSTIQQAVNTVKELTHIDQTVPFIASVLEQPITLLTNKLDNDSPRFAEECVELPPIKSLPQDMSQNVLESIVNEFRDVRAETVEIRRAKTEELKKKLNIYNSIMEKKHDEEVIFSSKRTKKKDLNSPQISTPVRMIDNSRLVDKAHKVNTESTYGHIDNGHGSPSVDTTDSANLQKEIEEKEKILAKMLNLEFLSISQYSTDSTIQKEDNLNSHSSVNDKLMNNDLLTRSEVIRNSQTENENSSSSQVFNSSRKTTRERFKVQNDIMTRSEIPLHSESKVQSKKFGLVRRQNSCEDLQPKLAKIPLNWNLQNLNIAKNSNLATPDKEIDDEWEFV